MNGTKQLNRQITLIQQDTCKQRINRYNVIQYKYYLLGRIWRERRFSSHNSFTRARYFNAGLFQFNCAALLLPITKLIREILLHLYGKSQIKIDLYLNTYIKQDYFFFNSFFLQLKLKIEGQHFLPFP